MDTEQIMQRLEETARQNGLEFLGEYVRSARRAFVALAAMRKKRFRCDILRHTADELIDSLQMSITEAAVLATSTDGLNGITGEELSAILREMPREMPLPRPGGVAS